MDNQQSIILILKSNLKKSGNFLDINTYLFLIKLLILGSIIHRISNYFI